MSGGMEVGSLDVINGQKVVNGCGKEYSEQILRPIKMGNWLSLNF